MFLNGRSVLANAAAPVASYAVVRLNTSSVMGTLITGPAPFWGKPNSKFRVKSGYDVRMLQSTYIIPPGVLDCPTAPRAENIFWVIEDGSNINGAPESRSDADTFNEDPSVAAEVTGMAVELDEEYASAIPWRGTNGCT